MAAALLASLSRSGLTAGAAGLVSVVVLSRGRLPRRGRAGLIAALAVVVIVAATYTNIGAMMLRLNDALANGVGGRRDIWSLTRTIIDDFRLVGVGVGAYARVMSVYQPPHLFAYNHAHDEYLQVLAEGGVVLSAAVVVVVIAGAIRAARSLARDRTPMFWIRVGAISGLIAIGVQSIWETGLRMPANAVLFSLCAAVAVHRGRENRTLRGMSFADLEDYRAATADVFEDIAGYSVGFLGLVTSEAPAGGDDRKGASGRGYRGGAD
jgi:O-antigen ligase